MKKKTVVIISVCAALLIGIIAVVIFVLSGSKSYRQVKVDDIDGDVVVVRDDDEMDAFEDMKLISKDEVQVGKKSSVVLLVDNDKHIAAEENTTFKITATGSERKGEVKIDLVDGNALFTIDNKLPDGSTFKVKTPNATLSVRGTEFRVTYDPKNNETSLEVLEGTVRVNYEGDDKPENVEAGESRLINENGVFSDNIVVTESEEASADTGNNDADDTEGKGSDGTKENGSDGTESRLSLATSGGDRKSVRAAYQNVIDNMATYVASNSLLAKEYISYDYMFYDYDNDGEKEVILYLEFEENDIFYRDVVFMDYFPEKQMVDTVAVVNYDIDDKSFYCEYDGRMARYSWITNPFESYLYIVYVDDAGSLRYVLEKGYDYIVEDLDAEGMKPLPLYGTWEMLPED